MKRDDVGVRGGEAMEGELAPLEMPLARVESDVVQALYSCERREG